MERQVAKLTPPKHGRRGTIAIVEPLRDRLLTLPRESELVFTTLRGHHYTPIDAHHHWNRVRCARRARQTSPLRRHAPLLRLVPAQRARTGRPRRRAAAPPRRRRQARAQLYGHPDAAIARERIRAAFRRAGRRRPARESRNETRRRADGVVEPNLSFRARFENPCAVGDFRPPANPQGQQRWEQGNSDGVATRADRRAGHLPAWGEVRSGLPRGRATEQAVRRPTWRGLRDQATARGEARALRRGPTLHAFSLSWLDRYAGSGHDSVRANTRREYRRPLLNFALTYFDREIRVHDLDRGEMQHFVDWLTTSPR